MVEKNSHLSSFTVTNTGQRAGADVPQLCLTNAAGDPRMRLLAVALVEPHRRGRGRT